MAWLFSNTLYMLVLTVYSSLVSVSKYNIDLRTTSWSNIQIFTVKRQITFTRLVKFESILNTFKFHSKYLRYKQFRLLGGSQYYYVTGAPNGQGNLYKEVFGTLIYTPSRNIRSRGYEGSFRTQHRLVSGIGLGETCICHRPLLESGISFCAMKCGHWAKRSTLRRYERTD